MLKLLPLRTKSLVRCARLEFITKRSSISAPSGTVKSIHGLIQRTGSLTSQHRPLIYKADLASCPSHSSSCVISPTEPGLSKCQFPHLEWVCHVGSLKARHTVIFLCEVLSSLPGIQRTLTIYSFAETKCLPYLPHRLKAIPDMACCL